MCACRGAFRVGGWGTAAFLRRLVCAVAERVCDLYWLCVDVARERRLGTRRIRKGDKALAGDVWIRPLTNSAYFKSGRIHHSALGGAAIGPPLRTRASWQSEISGRLKSQCGDTAAIVAQANGLARRQLERARARGESGSKISFVAIAYARVRTLRDGSDADLALDVFHEPTCRDRAHANLVALNQPPEYLKEGQIRARLVEMLQVVAAQNVDQLPAVE